MITVIFCLLYIAGGSKVVHSGGGAAGDDGYDVSGKLVVLMQLLVYNYDRLVSSHT